MPHGAGQVSGPPPRHSIIGDVAIAALRSVQHPERGIGPTVGAGLDALGECPPGLIRRGRPAAGPGVPAAADVHADLGPAGTDAAFDEPVRGRRRGAPGFLQGEALLFFGGSPAGPLQVA